MKLALFDLDNTLISGDSQSEWGSFLKVRGLLQDQEAYDLKMQEFYRTYDEGRLNIDDVIEFQVGLLSSYPQESLYHWREEYIRTQIRPLMLRKGMTTVQHHQQQYHDVVMITATSEFFTEPIAKLFGIDHLIATQLERATDGSFTGRPLGTSPYKEGKVTRFYEWLAEQGRSMNDYAEIWFYSDSHNDIPLLSIVDYPIAVNPDRELLEHARKNKWEIIDFRNEGYVA